MSLKRARVAHYSNHHHHSLATTAHTTNTTITITTTTHSPPPHTTTHQSPPFRPSPPKPHNCARYVPVDFSLSFASSTYHAAWPSVAYWWLAGPEVFAAAG